jgi:hypothetical protein
MFVGHYGVALAAKRLGPGVSLGVLFLAVQGLDVLLAGFVLAGVEKMRIIHGFTRVCPYDLWFIPYSHSLVGAVLWSAAAALGYGLATAGGASARSDRAQRERVIASLVVGLAVLSHFALDVPMHPADLPLGFDESSFKIGLGLWNEPDIDVVLELGVLVAGGAIYLGTTRPRDAGGTRGVVAFGVILAALAVATPFLPDPPSTTAWALQALAAFFVLALAAARIDGRRETAPEVARASAVPDVGAEARAG